MSMWSGTVQQLSLRRTPKLIRQSDPELCHLLLVVGGAGVGTWGDREAVYRPSEGGSHQPAVRSGIISGPAPLGVRLQAQGFRAQ